MANRAIPPLLNSYTLHTYCRDIRPSSLPPSRIRCVDRVHSKRLYWKMNTQTKMTFTQHNKQSSLHLARSAGIVQSLCSTLWRSNRRYQTRECCRAIPCRWLETGDQSACADRRRFRRSIRGLRCPMTRLRYVYRRTGTPTTAIIRYKTRNDIFFQFWMFLQFLTNCVDYLEGNRNTMKINRIYKHQNAIHMPNTVIFHLITMDISNIIKLYFVEYSLRVDNSFHALICPCLIVSTRIVKQLLIQEAH